MPSEREDREILSARTFDAPPERVFAAFTDAARLARWWGPEGFTTTIQAFDPRPGGAWRAVLHGPDGADYPSESVFVAVEEPSRIVFRHVSEQHPYELTIDLAPEGAGTRCTWRMRHATAEQCARVRAVVEAGNEQNFDRLAAELERSA